MSTSCCRLTPVLPAALLLAQPRPLQRAGGGEPREQPLRTECIRPWACAGPRRGLPSPRLGPLCLPQLRPARERLPGPAGMQKLGAQAGASSPFSASRRLQKTFSGPRAAPIRVRVWFREPGMECQEWGTTVQVLCLSCQVTRRGRLRTRLSARCACWCVGPLPRSAGAWQCPCLGLAHLGP